MISPELVWSGAYIAAMAPKYDGDHRRLAEDTVSFTDTMMRVLRQRHPIPAIENMKETSGQDAPKDMDETA